MIELQTKSTIQSKYSPKHKLLFKTLMNQELDEEITIDIIEKIKKN